MFWNKSKKKPKKKSVREMALDIKASSNKLVQDFNYPISIDELTTLIAVISYMDTFILKCLDGEIITNRIWIGTVLMSAIKTLVKSKKSAIKDIVYQLAEFEYALRKKNND